jgi:membrane-anchored protein YejM (alkaline phosphatase superfamily)
MSILWFSSGLFILLGNAKLFELYHFHINGMVLELLTGGSFWVITDLSGIMWLLIGVIAALCLAFEAFLTYFLWKKENACTWNIKYIVASLFIMFTSQLIHIFSDALGQSEVVVSTQYIPWAQPATANKLLKKLGIHVVRRHDFSPKKGRLNYPLKPLTCNAQKVPNILFIVTDSLRFDMITNETMPNTWHFAQNQIQFTNHFSTGNATRYGLFGLMTGLPGIYWHNMLSEEKSSVLIDALLLHQYDIHLYGSSPLNSPEFDRAVFSKVKNTIYYSQKKGTSYIRDIEILDQAKEMIKRRNNSDKPYFSLVFFDAPHSSSFPPHFATPFGPLSSDRNYFALNQNYDPTLDINRYKTSVYFVDRLIKELLNTVVDQQQMNNTIVLITGDHGQAFNELKKNDWEHNNSFSDYQTRVPMIIHWPTKPAATVDKTTTHNDIVPTLLTEALGCTNDISDYSTGENIFKLKEEHKLITFDSWTHHVLRVNDLLMDFSRNGVETYNNRLELIKNQTLEPRYLQKSLKDQSRFLH